MRVVRYTGLVLFALVAVVLLAIPTMTSAMAATAFMLGGIGAGVLPDFGVMSSVLKGAYTGLDNLTPSEWAPARQPPSLWQRENVVWPAKADSLGQSVAEGAATLLQEIKTTPGPK